MKWHSAIIGLAALVGALFFLDMVFDLRFRFSPGSFGRLFFFSIAVAVGTMGLTIAALVAYAKGWKSWTRAERIGHSVLVAIPIAYWTCFFTSAMLFAMRGD